MLKKILRIIKRPKLFFLDSGLAVRLQGWSDPMPMLNSMQIGGLFETLALGEMVKFIRNKEFGEHTKMVVITSGGERLKLSRDCMVLPIMQLHDYLCEIA